MRQKFSYAVLLLFLWTLAFPLSAQASAPYDGKVVMGGSYTLASGEQLQGDLVVMGGSATVEQGATVHGNVALFGGSLELAGIVQGDVTIFGGSVTLPATAHVSGDLVSLGGNVERAEGAYVGGEVVTGEGLPFNFSWHDQFPRTYGFASGQYAGPLNRVAGFFLSLMWFVFQVCMLSALAVLTLTFLETPVQRISQSMLAQPALAGGLGCLSLLVVPALLLLLALTILLLPVSFVGFVVLALLALYGWVAMGYEVGQRLSAALGQRWSAPVAAGVGTGLFTLVVGGVGKVVPCVGWVVPLVAVGLGLGAVILTRFGTQPYPEAVPDAFPALEAETGDVASQVAAEPEDSTPQADFPEDPSADSPTEAS